MNRKAGVFALAVQTMNGGQESITAEEAGLYYQSDGSIQKLMKEQKKFLWLLSLNHEKEYEISEAIGYDEQRLRETILQLKCMQNAIEPADACIEETEDGFVIVPEVLGNALDLEKTFLAIQTALTTMTPSVALEKEGCYKLPAVYQNDELLQKNCQQMNELTDIIITYDFANQTEVVDRSVIKDWLIRNEQGDLVPDRQKVAEFVDELGYQYDTFGKERLFRTYDGREILIPGGGDYGWVIDQEAETDALIEAIMSGETQVREPIYEYSAWSRDNNDIGYTYIEINLTAQRLVLYVNGSYVVDTPIVTGNPNLPGCETPVGCFAIDAMQSPAVLTGEDYAAEVQYWIPFCGNVGIHDASWRTEFGNNLYLFEGSHGCVNVPYERAAEIFRNVQTGMPVVVYQ